MLQQPVYPIYHIKNPVRQPWDEMIAVLSEEPGIPWDNVVPYDEWQQRVCQFSPTSEMSSSHNPAARLVDFFKTDFLRMSCVGVILSTTRSKEHSETLRNLRPISRDLVRKHIHTCREPGFLS